MSKRSTGRKLAMQALYQAEIRHLEVSQILEEMFEEKNFVKETKDWAAQLAQGTYKEKDQLDEVIKKYAIDWSRV